MNVRLIFENELYLRRHVRFINGGGKGAVKKESRDVLSTNGWIFLCQREGE